MVDETRWCWPRHEVEMKETKHSSSYVVMSVEDPPQCRICLSDEGDVVESPCACQGTQRWVHDTCLVRWRQSGGNVRRAQCEICRTLYTLPLPVAVVEEETEESLSILRLSATMNVIFDCVNVGFSLLDNDDPPDHTIQLSGVMGVSSVLKGLLFLYMLYAHRSGMCMLTSVMFVYVGALMWDYTEGLHAILNLSYGILLLNNALEDQ